MTSTLEMIQPVQSKDGYVSHWSLRHLTIVKLCFIHLVEISCVFDR